MKPQNIKKLIIAVDGGATGCRVEIANESGVMIGKAKGGPASLTLGVEQSWANIKAAIELAIRGTGIDIHKDCDLTLIAGLAGAQNEERAATFRASAPFPFTSITIVADGCSSLYGALAGKPGIVIAIGTGIIGYALHLNGTILDASGWGFQVGDEGSGAWIGRQAAQALCKWKDGRIQTPSSLFASIEGKISNDPAILKSWFAEARSTEFASLAPLVVDAAEKGDALAQIILKDAIAEHLLVIDALDTPDKTLSIALLGGLAPVFAPHYPDHIKSRLKAPIGTALSGLMWIHQNAEETQLRAV